MRSYGIMFCYKIQNKIGDIFFRLWTKIATSLSRRFQYFDTWMFLSNEMDKNFEWKKYVKKKNPYFKKWGFRVSHLDAAYYSRVSGIVADHYVTRSMAVHYIYPYLDRYDFVPAYMDKNIQDRLLGLPDVRLGILTTEHVVYNSNGIFFGPDGRECCREAALNILSAYKKAMILKPSIESFGGRGVIMVPADANRSYFEKLIEQYRYNFTFQKVVQQHLGMAQFNPSSVNTVRIVTYRDFERKIKILYAVVRFGGDGAVMDNVCSGGGYTGINLTSGELINRKRYSYFQMDVPVLPNNFPNIIPCWERIRTAALQLHERLPQMDIIGWDFAVSTEGMPVLIEFNPRPGVGLQQAVGPMFSKEDLDQIMSHVSKVRAEYRPFGVLKFEDYPERRTVHTKFGSN